MVTTGEQESELDKGEETNTISFMNLQQHLTVALCTWLTPNNKTYVTKQ